MAKFVARLITNRELERAVQVFGCNGPELVDAARKWLEAKGKSGDRFDIHEQREELFETVHK